MLIGNKSDIESERIVPKESGKKVRLKYVHWFLPPKYSCLTILHFFECYLENIQASFYIKMYLICLHCLLYFQLAAERNIQFYETSAYANINIDEVSKIFLLIDLQQLKCSLNTISC